MMSSPTEPTITSSPEVPSVKGPEATIVGFFPKQAGPLLPLALVAARRATTPITSRTPAMNRRMIFSPVVTIRTSDHTTAETRTQASGRADEYAFCHAEHGTKYVAKWFEAALKEALASAGIAGPIRAFHDLRHTAITNDAAAGANPGGADDEGRSREYGDDEDLHAPGRGRLPR
jgi:hypothetical protein